jgi:hemolysin activation/secretion protein
MPSTALRASALALLAPFAFAQEAPPPAKVVGPQSVVESYNAPVAKGGSIEGLIDFPKLISEPGANDGVQITPSLTALDLEIVGTEGTARLDDFITVTGQSRTGKKRPALHAALAAVLAKYRDLPLTLGDARFIQQDITDAYRETGYPLLAVVVPPQEIVNGRLRVQINEFSLSAYKVTYADKQGAYSPDAPHRTNERRVAALFDPLLREPILSQASLDKKVKWLNAGPYRQARVIFEPGQQLGETTALVQIDEKRPWSVQAGYNNHATKASGTDRYSLGGSFGYLPFENHQLSWNATVGNNIDEFENYSLIYTIPNRLGHTLTANVNYSDTASSSIPGIGSASTTLQSSLDYSVPLLETGTFNWTLNATAFLKQFERDSLFGGVVVGGARFDSTQLVVNNTFNVTEATATNQFVFGTIFSFDGLTSRNTDADLRQFYNNVNGRAATQHFVLNYARVQQLAPLLGGALDGWSAETQLSWQFTTQQLAGSDNFAIGGPQAMRAYESSEVAGDEGFYAIQFLHLKPLSSDSLGVTGKWIQQLAPSLFIEGGEGRFKNGASGSLWDYGVQLAASAKPGLRVTASLAIAGKSTAVTDRHEARFYLSGSLSY